MTYDVVWHRGRTFRLTFDPATNTLTIPNLLPELERKAPLYKTLTTFVDLFAGTERPAHRRALPEKVQLMLSIKARFARLSIRAVDSDVEYALMKLVQVVNEIYMLVLPAGEYFAYRVEHLGYDPEWGG